MTARTGYEQAADSGVGWLLAQLGDDGSFGAQADDLACYYKLPYLLALSGRPREAARLLDYVERRFMHDDGDFATDGDHKSDNAAFGEYWAYPNAWLALGSLRLGRLELAYRAWAYLRAFDAPDGGFRTRRPRPGAGDDVVDVLTSAHVGLLALSFGERSRAHQAGEYLGRVLDSQDDLGRGLLLRTSASGKLVDTFAPSAAAFHVVDRSAPDQAYFMVGYPIAFLAKLAEVTGERAYLASAGGYLQFALSCEGNLRASPLSHKVAWGAATFGRIAQHAQAIELATLIADFLLEIQQPSGAWLADQPPHTTFDQTAEIAIWLQEISVELARAAASNG